MLIIYYLVYYYIIQHFFHINLDAVAMLRYPALGALPDS